MFFNKPWQVRIFGFLLLVSCLASFVAVYSYDPTDPSLSTVTTSAAHNWLGIIGSFMSDIVVQYLGFYFLLITAAGFVLGVLMIKAGNYPDKFNRRVLAVFVCYLFLAIADDLYHKDFRSVFGSLVVNGVITPYFKTLNFGWLYEYVTLVGLCILALLLWLYSAGLRIRSVLYGIYVVLRALYRVARWFTKSRFSKRIVKQSLNLKVSREKITKKQVITTSKQSGINKVGAYIPPSIDLMDIPESEMYNIKISKEDLKSMATQLAQALKDFGVEGEIVKAKPGPIVTLYEFIPAPGIKSSRIISLADDIARTIGALGARISLIPGKTALGIEIPNSKRKIVQFKDMLEDDLYKKTEANLPLVLGTDIAGNINVEDLTTMPHLLVAGTTGSGKSVALNTMILSLIYKLSPDECRFVMIDPKMLELSIYSNIPHMMAPVVTEPKKAVLSLKWAVKEMENRYRLMSQLNNRNIIDYNLKIDQAVKNGTVLTQRVQTGFDSDSGQAIFENKIIAKDRFPYLVIIIDEMADLMIVAGKEVESLVQRLAQMARAAGIHLIMATQRPSVDVITGTIKANFPTRISFQVSSGDDSRTIIGTIGAEQLLGKGDLLFLRGGGKPERMHAPKINTSDIEAITKYLEDLNIETRQIEIAQDDGFNSVDKMEATDPLVMEAIKIVRQERKASTSYIQRQLKIGYNRAANIMEELERMSIVSAPNNTGKREVLLPEM